jgi:hypothetical protein
LKKIPPFLRAPSAGHSSKLRRIMRYENERRGRFVKLF